MTAVRITGGIARGRVLREPVGSGVRPTSARVREALFSMLGQDQRGQRILDAFGGAGLVGLEAWSRGAQVTVFERDRRTWRGIVQRGEQVGADWTVRHGDVIVLARHLEPFDGVFADPPYGTDPAVVIEALAPLARAWLVLETDAGTSVPAEAGALPLDRVRRYGRTQLAVYRHAGS